jgi:hypothetical protein
MIEHVQVAAQDNVLRITLNRPEKKNAPSRAMYLALIDALEQAEQDASIRAVLFTGSGDSFSAGNDIGDFHQSPDDEAPSAVSAFTDRIVWFGKPLVAAVNGLAVGIGATMPLHCDIVYADEKARFRLPFVVTWACGDVLTLLFGKNCRLAFSPLENIRPTIETVALGRGRPRAVQPMEWLGLQAGYRCPPERRGGGPGRECWSCLT